VTENEQKLQDWLERGAKHPLEERIERLEEKVFGAVQSEQPGRPEPAPTSEPTQWWPKRKRWQPDKQTDLV
jgi:hypothetical protein